MSAEGSEEASEVGSTLPTGAEEIEPEVEPGEGPRCARCSRVVLGEWINWQKCWSIPGIGDDGQPFVLAQPRFQSGPLMLRLQGQGMFGDRDFWWFFICVPCRLQLIMRGLNVDRHEVEDRFFPGSEGKGAQVKPTFVPRAMERDATVNEEYGVGEFWIRPPSPPSSESSDPWAGPS